MPNSKIIFLNDHNDKPDRLFKGKSLDHSVYFSQYILKAYFKYLCHHLPAGLGGPVRLSFWLCADYFAGNNEQGNDEKEEKERFPNIDDPNR